MTASLANFYHLKATLKGSLCWLFSFTSTSLAAAKIASNQHSSTPADLHKAFKALTWLTLPICHQDNDAKKLECDSLTLRSYRFL